MHESWCRKNWKMAETLALVLIWGYSARTIQWVPTNVASGLEGLRDICTFKLLYAKAYFYVCTYQSLFTWISFGLPTCDIALNFYLNQPFQLKTMGAIVSHNSLQLSIWQPVHDVIGKRPVCIAASVQMRPGQHYCENGHMCCLWML